MSNSNPLRQFSVGSDTGAVFPDDGTSGEEMIAILTGRPGKEDGEGNRSYGYTIEQLAAHIALCQYMLNFMIGKME